MKKLNNKDLIKIFNGVEKTFFAQSELSAAQLNKNLEYFKNIDKKRRGDNDYFWIMVKVAFYSGFKAKTVNDKMAEIENFFGDFLKVAKYNDEKVQKIIDSKKIIGHRQKIKGIIHNANEIKTIIKEFGSFKNYLKSFGDHSNDENLFILIKDLRKRFKYLGGITVYHFLTDIGFNVLKPDRVLCRIFNRLGLVEDENDLFEVISAGRRISEATGHPIRYVDIIFVAYGQVDAKPEFGLTEGICLSTNPKCKKCGVVAFCNYKKKKSL